jgi:hypothetical protein
MRNEGDGGRKTGLRVVLDTNVYISIFTRPESAIFQVCTYAVHNHYELIVSPVIVGGLLAFRGETFIRMRRKYVSM